MALIRRLLACLVISIIPFLDANCQKRLSKPIELSLFHTISISYSKLTVLNPNISTHSYLNASDYGIKIQRQLRILDTSLFLTGMIGGTDLSVSGKFAFTVNREALKAGEYVTGKAANKTILPHYWYFSSGIKKIVISKKRMSYNFETGIKLLLKTKSIEPNAEDTYMLNGEKIVRQFTFEKSKKLTPLPYFALGLDYKIRKIKIGFQIWIQNSFVNMYQYDYKVDYKTTHYESKIYTTGLAWGSNLYLRLITF